MVVLYLFSGGGLRGVRWIFHSSWWRKFDDVI